MGNARVLRKWSEEKEGGAEVSLSGPTGKSSSQSRPLRGGGNLASERKQTPYERTRARDPRRARGLTQRIAKSGRKDERVAGEMDALREKNPHTNRRAARKRTNVRRKN